MIPCQVRRLPIFSLFTESIATAQGEVNKAINEYVLRTTATQFQTIELKEYQLNSVVGVQFDLSGDNYAVKVGITVLFG